MASAFEGNGQWLSRIVDEGAEPPDQLLANPGNWRIHPRAQQEALAGVLDEVGWVQRVIVNRTTGNLVDGHLRATLAMRRNEPLVPVQYVELTEEEEKLILATLDPLAAMAVADAEQLEALLQDIATGDEAVQAMLEELAGEVGIAYGEQEDPPEDAGAQIDRAEELREQWGVESGQLWKLGEHRVICGDCTDAAVVEQVMGGERAGAVVTDPPYGINREGIQNDDPKGLRMLYETPL